jgi:hypothetical protein
MQKKDAVQVLQVRADEMNKAVEQMYNLPRNPISDTTNFIVTATTVDTAKMDNRFDDRNSLFLLAIDKFSALAALNPLDQSLRTLIWQDMLYGIKFEFWDRAERKALEIIQLYNETRGQAGPYNFSEQLITTREVLISKHKAELEDAKKAGTWNWFRKKQPPQQEGPMMAPGMNQ